MAEVENTISNDESSKAAKEALQTAGKIAIAAALATTLSAAPVSDKAYVLPDPTPIVYVLPPDVPDEPVVEPEDEPAEDESLWKKILKHLKYILLALFLMAALLFGAVKGCAALGGAVPFLPDASAAASASASASAMRS